MGILTHRIDLSYFSKPDNTGNQKKYETIVHNWQQERRWQEKGLTAEQIAIKRRPNFHYNRWQCQRPSGLCACEAFYRVDNHVAEFRMVEFHRNRMAEVDLLI